MKNYSLPKYLAAIFLFSCLSSLHAQHYEPIPIQSGFNADVIANGVGSAYHSTNNDIDDTGFALISADYKQSSGSAALSYGLPVDGKITTQIASTPGLEFKLADYNQDNALRIRDENASGTIAFGTPVRAETLYMLATSGSGASKVDIKVNFSDESSQVFSEVTINDWFSGSGFAISGIGRIYSSTDVLELNASNPRLYQISLAIDSPNVSKFITSVNVTKKGTSGVANIFAFSGDLYNSCLAPTDITATTGMSTAEISWTSSVINPDDGYDYYLSNSAAAPNETTPRTGNVGTTSLSLDSLTEGETYFLWIRSNCGSSTLGYWKKIQFTTAQITAAYTAGDISTSYNNSLDLSSATPCPGLLSVTVPSGYKIKNTSVSYSMSTANNGWLSEQRSLLACTTNGVTESGIYSGSGSTQGTINYNRSSLTIANGLTGTVDFELRAWRTYGGTDCNTDYNKVDNNTWKVTLTLEPVTLAVEDRDKTLFVMYPNPFTDFLNLSSVENVSEITVSDLLGKTHRTIQNPENSLDLSDLSNGAYLVTVKLNDGSYKTIKALKQ